MGNQRRLGQIQNSNSLATTYRTGGDEAQHNMPKLLQTAPSGHKNRTKLKWLLLHQLSLNLGLLIGTLTTPNNTRDPITTRLQQCGQSITSREDQMIID